MCNKSNLPTIAPTLVEKVVAVMPGRKGGAGGFTLIELMIVVVLMTFIILWGLPTLSGVIANLRLRAVAEGVVGAAQTARSEAARRNQSVTFQIDVQQGGGWSIMLADNTVLQSKAASEGGSVLVQPDLANAVTFNNLGRRTLPAGGVMTFLFSNPAAGDCQPAGDIRCLSMTIQPGGQIKLCDPLRVAPDPQAC
jgi:type IV fimbrial biogenesis protein FimT